MSLPLLAHCTAVTETDGAQSDLLSLLIMVATLSMPESPNDHVRES